MNGKLTRIARALTISMLVLGTAAPALAQDGDGGEQGDGVYQAQVVQVDTSNFPQVSVYVSVTDEQGNPVGTLGDSAITLLENGEPVEITEIFQAGEQGPVTTVLTIDRSGSMNDGGKITAAKEAATAFVDLMRAEDRTGVVAFNTQVDVIQPLTSDKTVLREAIESIEAWEDTAMYDAIAASVELLQGVDGRKAIVLLSDGLDNRSQQTLEGIVSGLSDAEISVYTIGLGNPALVGTNAGIDEAALNAIAEQSRGQYIHAPNPEELSGLYQQISLRLQNEYRLTYTTSNPLRNGVARSIEVRVAEATTVQAGYNPGGLVPETSETLSWPVFAALLGALALLLFIPPLLQRGRGMARQSRPTKGRVKLGAPPAASKQVDPMPEAKKVRMRKKGA